MRHHTGPVRRDRDPRMRRCKPAPRKCHFLKVDVSPGDLLWWRGSFLYPGTDTSACAREESELEAPRAATLSTDLAAHLGAAAAVRARVYQLIRPPTPPLTVNDFSIFTPPVRQLITSSVSGELPRPPAGPAPDRACA